MIKQKMNPTTVGQRFARLAIVAVGLTLPLAGCENILEVTDPDIVTPDALASEIGLQTLRNGALGDFTFAYAGAGFNEGIILASGLITDSGCIPAPSSHASRWMCAL